MSVTKPAGHARAALIVGLACGVITILFLMQQFGTGAIGYLFPPIILTWLTFICGARPLSSVHRAWLKALAASKASKKGC